VYQNLFSHPNIKEKKPSGMKLAIDHCFSIYIYLDRKLNFHMGVYTIDNVLHKKWSNRQTAELSVENFDGENVDELIKFIKFVNIFPCQNFVPYGSYHPVIL